MRDTRDPEVIGELILNRRPGRPVLEAADWVETLPWIPNYEDKDKTDGSHGSVQVSNTNGKAM